MAHTYYGSGELILTAKQKEIFPSGLSRLDCTFRCRTTSAGGLAAELMSGQRIPGHNDFIIGETANQTDGNDGFSTFAVSGFNATLVTEPDASNPLPTTLGASLVDCAVNVESTSISCESTTPPCEAAQVVSNQSYQIKILSDTLTRKLTIEKNYSITDLALPNVDLKFRVLYVLNTSKNKGGERMTLDGLDLILKGSAVYPSSFQLDSINNKLLGSIDILNVNRTNFGEYDEVTITWGFLFAGISLSISTDYRNI
jgi:hypothetical protein